MKNIYLQALDLFALRDDIALATVISSSGSTPQKAGCTAIIGTEGIIRGTIGGGFIEGEISRLANKSTESRYYSFNLNNDISAANEPVCGGRMEIIVDSDPVRHSKVFEALRDSLNNGIPGTLITTISPDHKHSSVEIHRSWSTDTPDTAETTTTKHQESIIFTEPVFPPPHLVIAGAGHIGKAVSHLGNFLGFEVTVIDDRSEYANSDNLPDADHIIAADIGQSIRNLRKTSSTYIVIVTRGHHNDTEALRECINHEVAYIGVIGSRRKLELMRSQFMENEWTSTEQWEKIYAPVGVNIGSKTVEEIAVSIAAELIRARNAKVNRYV